MTTTISTDSFVDWPVRLANIVIDIVIIYIALFGILFFAMILSSSFTFWITSLGDLGYNIFGVLTMSFYYIIIELTTQRSVGKYITGTMVVMEDGSKPQARAIVIRTFCRFLPFEVFSFLGSYPRGWHDSASGTYVVNAKKYRDALRVKEAFNEIGMQEA